MDPRRLLSRSLRKPVSPLPRAGSVTFFEHDLAIPVPRAKAVVRGRCAVNLAPHADQGRALPARQPPPSMASDLRVETFTDVEALLGLEPIWDDLVERAQIDHPFLTHAWVRSWWEAFGAGKELRILAVFSGQTCIGVAPLMTGTARVYWIPLRRLELIGNVHSPRADFIIAARPRGVPRDPGGAGEAGPGLGRRRASPAGGRLADPGGAGAARPGGTPAHRHVDRAGLAAPSAEWLVGELPEVSGRQASLQLAKPARSPAAARTGRDGGDLRRRAARRRPRRRAADRGRGVEGSGRNCDRLAARVPPLL